MLCRQNPLLGRGPFSKNKSGVKHKQNQATVMIYFSTEELDGRLSFIYLFIYLQPTFLTESQGE